METNNIFGNGINNEELSQEEVAEMMESYALYA